MSKDKSFDEDQPISVKYPWELQYVKHGRISQIKNRGITECSYCNARRGEYHTVGCDAYKFPEGMDILEKEEKEVRDHGDFWEKKELRIPNGGSWRDER